MNIKEYFSDWAKVIDLKEADRIMHLLYPQRESLCPLFGNIFKAFRLCPIKTLRCVIIGQDPYPNVVEGQPVATGIAFANKSTTPESRYSPSLNIIRESVINFYLPHGHINFDPSLESWEKQGVLLLNAALTCHKNRAGSNTLMWRPFMVSFLKGLSEYTSGIVYVLMGSSAQTLEHGINGKSNHILKCNHPAWYAREHKMMPDVWNDINGILEGQNGTGIQWYKEV